MLRKNKIDLNIGDVVKYKAPKSIYEYESKYIDDYSNKKIILNNNSFSLKIDKWRVLNINDTSIELVPNKIPFKRIAIYGTYGYNNAVYFLNEMCRVLYSDKDKEITARSIKIEDIEGIIKANNNILELDKIKRNTKFYGVQTSKNGYFLDNSWYPKIYEFENMSVVDGKENINGLGLSDTKDEIIKGKVQAKKGIHPYKSFYNTTHYEKTVELLGGSSSIFTKLLLPKKNNTTYWIASRCIGNGTSSVHFDLRRILKGLLRAARMYDSQDIISGASSHLFPIVTVNIDKIKIDKNNEYYI